MNKKWGLLRIASIMCNVYWGIFAAFGAFVIGICLVPATYTVTGWGYMLTAGIFAVLWSAVGISMGIIGLRLYNGKGNSKAVKILPLILILFEIASLLISIIAKTFDVEVIWLDIINLALPIIYIIGARQIAHKESL
ncbi:MAG: hypothetical protein RR573_01075 [Oscillospiraceae bacterium]